MAQYRAAKSEFAAEAHNKINSKYDPRLSKELLEWIAELLNENLDAGDGDKQTFYEVLKDGQLLCRLINAIKPGTIKKIHNSTMPFKCMENIQSFLKGANQLGVPSQELFQSCDLWDQMNLTSVQVCLQSVARKAPKYGIKGIGSKEANISQEKCDTEINERLKEFVKTFVKKFEEEITFRHDVVAGNKKISSKVSNMSKTTGKVAGAFVGISLGVPGLGADLGGKVGKKVGSLIGDDDIKKSARIIEALPRRNKDFRKILVEAGIEIFRNFESQFMVVDADGGWKIAMESLAKEAVERIINYIYTSKSNNSEIIIEASNNIITEGVILGKSKDGEALKTKRKNKIEQKKWNTAKLYEKVGVVTIKSNGTPNKYYKKRDGSSKTSKYGYRLLFKWELKSLSELNKKYQEENNTLKEEYKYISKPEKMKQKLYDILNEINEEDPKLQFGIIREEFEKSNKEIKKVQEGQEKLEEMIALLYSRLAINQVELILRDIVTGSHNNMESLDCDLNNEEIEVIKTLKDKIKASKVVGISWIYKGKIENIINKYNVNFKTSIDGLDAFLDDNEEQIFCINTEETLLTSIKVYQYLKNKPGYKEDMDNSHIFINLEGLLWTQKITKEIVKKAFKQGANLYDLLVIECEPVATGKNQINLFNQLLEVINNNPKKKIVLITSKKEDNTLAKKFSEIYKNPDPGKPKKYRELIDDKTINLSNIKDCSKILEKNIKFQGKDTNLNELLDNIEKDKLDEVIDTKTFTRLIKDIEEITISSKPVQVSDLEAAYSKLYQDVKVKTLVEHLLSEKSNKLFMIGGINPGQEKIEDELIEKLEIKENIKAYKIKNKLVVYNSNFADGKHTKGKIIIYKEKQNQEEYFRKLSHNNQDKTIYWINWQDNKFVLQQLYDPKFYLERQFIYQQRIIVKKTIQELLVKQDLNEVFIFSNINNRRQLATVLGISKENFFENSKIITLGDENIAKKEFNKQSIESTAVHWIIVEKEKLILHSSHGSLKSLRNYIDNSQLCLKEKDFIEKIKNEP